MNGSTSHPSPEELLELYRITPEDLERIRGFAERGHPSMDRMVSDWYEWLEKQPEYEQFFSDKETLERAVGGVLADLPAGRRRRGLPGGAASRGRGPRPHRTPPQHLLRIDITDQVRAEEESRRALASLEEANAAKEEMIHQLSTPVIEVWDGVLVAPIIGHVDSARGSEIMQALLGACSVQARGVIIDITGIEMIDESTAAQLIRMCKAIQLLGSRPVISGVSPAVAQTMVHSDVALKSIKTVRSLKDGLEWFLAGAREDDDSDEA